MKPIKGISAWVLLSLTGLALAQPSLVRRGDVLEFSAGSDRVIVQACTSEILRVDFRPQGVISPRTPTIAQLPCGKVGANIRTNPPTLQTPRMQVRLDPTTLALEVRNPAGQTLLRDPGLAQWRSGVLGFQHDPKDPLYGVSIKQPGLTRPEGGVVVAGSQGQGGGPLVWSSAGYGILTDSDGGEFTNQGGSLRFAGGSRVNLEYFVLLGKPAEIIGSATLLTGRPPMFPKWALGFMNSEWGIDQRELSRTVDTYRSKAIPLDAYILDFDWKAWGEDDFGEFRWNSRKFPDGPSGALKALMDGKGVKLLGIMKPRVHLETRQGREVRENDLWFASGSLQQDYFSRKTVALLDFSKPQTRAWYWLHAKPALDSGLVGWWNDEADEGQGNFQFLNMQRSVYEGQRQDSGLRVFSLNRNFYLGAQRYGYGMWSGDIGSSFVTLNLQPHQLLAAANLAQPHWSMDTGGFSGDPSPELYARWMQFAAFVPIFRVHGFLDKQRQPWVYGPQAEALAKRAIELRYRLLPYLYSYERRALESGVGLVKPLIFDYPDDPKVVDETSSWMFGDYLLVSPVVEQGTSQHQIYLPPGTWTDYFRGTVYRGGQSLVYPVNPQTLADLPLFIKQGAIIPTQEVMQYVGEQPLTRVWVDLFPDSCQTAFSYYDDDGLSYAYEQGTYFKQLIRTQALGDGSRLKLEAPVGTFKPDLEFYVFRVHGFSGRVGGLRAYPDLQTLEEAEGEGYASGHDLYGDLTYLKLRAGEAKEVRVSR